MTAVHDGTSTTERDSAPESDGRIGVIDLGSNSIRLVVYERLGRSPLPIFNEKVMSGLGRGLQRTGHLHPDGRRMALENITRFACLADGMRVRNRIVLATAAVRDAVDGPSFVAEVERLIGCRVTVLDGAEEGRLSALGVVFGMPDADGIVGDLGGGSLELVPLSAGTITGEAVTVPVGPLRLMELDGGRPSLIRHIDTALEAVPALPTLAGRSFYAVGGSWRALAKAHMEQERHPLHVIHHYAAPGPAMRAFADLVSRQSRSSLERATAVSRRRTETLPYAALVLERLLRVGSPATVVFSAFGLREGSLFDRLSPAEQAADPLLDACADHARRLGRFEPSQALVGWTAALFPEESIAQRRLRTAVCLLGDIGWTDHPDYRAEHAFLRALRTAYPGMDHAERGFVALALFVRYGGRIDDPVLSPALQLTDEAARTRAFTLGHALRLAYTLTGGVVSLLDDAPLSLREQVVELSLSGPAAALSGEAVMRRLEALAAALDRRAHLQVRGVRQPAK